MRGIRLSNTTTVRAGALGDEERLARLNGFVQAIHVQQRPDHFRETQLPELAAWFKGALEKENTRVWIAEEDGVAVGYVLAVVHHASATVFTQPKDWLEIDQVAVDPNQRRRGTARALIERAVNEARAEGIHRAEASAWCFNSDAEKMFLGLGFTPRVVRFEFHADTASKS
jgi:GNAT superfamily N-acetyltransferase